MASGRAAVEQVRDIRALLADGALNGLSIGFRTVRAKRGASLGKSGGHLLQEIDLWGVEGSLLDDRGVVRPRRGAGGGEVGLVENWRRLALVLGADHGAGAARRLSDAA